MVGPGKNSMKNDNDIVPPSSNYTTDSGEDSDEEIEEFTGVSDPLPTGEILNERYEIISKIDSGKISTTYLAKDIKQNVNVNVKIAGLFRGGEENRMWKNLAKDDQKENFVKLKEFFQLQTPDGTLSVLVFEHYSKNLSDILAIHNKKVPFAMIRSIVSQILSGLECMHKKKNIFHSNIQISNIFLDENPSKVKIGTCWNKSIKNTQRTEFQSPEEIIGADSIGNPVDIWALGCLIFELATGDVLFTPEKNGN